MIKAVIFDMYETLITLFDKQKERYNELIHLYETTSPSIKYSIAYLMDNFVIVDNSLLKQMADLLEKQEDKYRKGNGTLYLEGAFSKIIQSLNTEPCKCQ